MTQINFRSRKGVSEPLGFVLAFPIWWALIGILLVCSLWFWSLAANTIALTRDGQAIAVGRDGEAARRYFVAAALGGYAKPYAQGTYTNLGRAVAAEIDHTQDASPFQVPKTYVVHVRVVSRLERFYAKPDNPMDPNAGWE